MRRWLGMALGAAITMVPLSFAFLSLWHAVVEFKTLDGRTHKFRSKTGWQNPGAPGEKVEVLYDPNDPSLARISGFFSLWAGTLVFAGVALICFACACVFLRLPE